ncbi:MAG: hypothetical protein Kow0042_08370 [Calditrichia bacterium]
MNEKSPTMKEWEQLYNTAIQIKDLAPWEWLEEHEIFAIQPYDSPEIGFVSVMGTIGEHYAISVYLGEEGPYGFWDLLYSTPDMFSYQKVLEIPQLQVSFEDRNMLHPKDQNIIKKLGLKFRGRHSWPLFRSYKPGYFPWYLSQDEARFLQIILDQTKEVVQKARENRSLLMSDDEESYFLRKAVRENDKDFWQDSTLKIIPKAPHSAQFKVKKNQMATLKTLTPQKVVLEIAVFIIPEAVKGKGTRPYYPYSLLLVDTSRKIIIGNQLLKPIPGLTEMWSTVPSQIVEILAKLQFLPQTISVNSELLHQYLLFLSEEVGITIELKDNLPYIDDARRHLLDFFS